MQNKYWQEDNHMCIEVRGYGNEAICKMDISDLNFFKQLGYSLYLDKKGYVRFGSNSKTFKERFGVSSKTLHRWLLAPKKDITIDHINGDKADNRRSNLKEATNLENCKKRRHIYKHNTSGQKGVSWHKKMKKWTANIRVNYELIWLGSFDTIEEAVHARKEAEQKYGFQNF
jgi:hypothetical protein